MKKLSLLIILTTISYLLTPNCGYALDLGFAKEDGGRPGAFLSYGAGARSLGLGKTFVGVADDASATYWNPAGLATLPKPEFTALYASMYEQTGYSFAAGVYPLKTVGGSQSAVGGKNLGTIGVALVNLSSRGFQLRDEYNYEMGEGGLSESAAILSYGTKLPFVVRGSSLMVGANLKLVNQNIDSRSDTGYGLDLGALTNYQKLTIGLSVQNILAPKLTLLEDTDKYPLSTTLGFSYRFFNNNLLTAVDLNKTGKRQVKLHVGAEYTFVKMLSFRAGIDETEVAAGLGFKWQNYSIDYAFAYHDAWKGYEDLGIAHRFGLTMKWGNTKQIVTSSYETGEKTEKQIIVNSSELGESTKNQELQTTNYELISSRSLPDSEPLTVEVAATTQALVDAQETGLTEERLKQKIKEQIEKETGEEVSKIEIEKMEEIAPAKSPGNLSTYIVKSGDCLWDIAGKAEIYNNSWNWILIYEANNDRIKNPDLIYPGQILKIPLKH